MATTVGAPLPTAQLNDTLWTLPSSSASASTRYGPAGPAELSKRVTNATLGSAESAAAAFKRPPCHVVFANAGTGSTLPATRIMTWRYVACGNCATTRAATPLACGVAIEVPLNDL